MLSLNSFCFVFNKVSGFPRTISHRRGGFISKGYDFFKYAAVILGQLSLWKKKRQASGCHLYRPIPNDRNKLDLRLNDKYYEFWTNLNLSFFSALMLKKSLKTFDNHVIVRLERWFDFRDYNYLGNTEPFALQKLFKFWDLFITVLKLQLTSSPNMSWLY